MLCRLYLPHVGGVERHVHAIVQEAAKDGHTITIVTSLHDPELSYVQQDFWQDELSDQIRILRIPVRSSNSIIERIMLWTWMLRHVGLFISADRIHIHDVFFWAWPIRILLPWKKMYMTFHGFEAGRQVSAKAIRARQIASRLTQGNIAVGAWIESWYKTKPTFVTYGGATPHTSTSRKDRTAVFVGRLEEDTGILSVIEFAKKHHVMLDIFGDGPLQEKVKRMIKGSPWIQYLGVTKEELLFVPYQYAFVSSYLSMLEAMQQKTLVVAFAVNELKVDYLACHPVVKAMVVVKSMSELEPWGEKLNAQDEDHMVEQAYTWAVSQTWKSVYDSCYAPLWHITPSHS